ncbi:Ig-like domain-containing protein [uncultured Methanoculleus sp.]|uniref:Ig-like domain-containing protein n=2 Tax=Methanoculleus TaxID=45989 RepID=UPI003204A93C
MKKHTHLALLCAIVVIGFLISPVMAVDAAPGEDLYRPSEKAQERPDIDGDTVVWGDDRYDEQNMRSMDIFLATIDDLRRTPPYSYAGTRITDDPASQERPSISGNYIVWQDNRHGNWDIYLYERSTGNETRLTTDTGDQWLPIVRGNYIAWYDDSNSGRRNVVLYDIAAGTVKEIIDCDAQIIPDGTSTAFKPALSEDYVAWVERADKRVHYYEIATGRTGTVSTSTAPQFWPSLSTGNLIAWEDYRHGTLNPDIYIADLDNLSAGERQITTDMTEQVAPAISGNLVAWEDKRGAPRGIFMYDLSTGKEMSVVLSADEYDDHLYPAVSGNAIVWQRGYSPDSNLYLFVYEPETPVDPVATTIAVAPTAVTLAINGTEQFSATVHDQFNAVMTGVTVTWDSDNETVGTIDDTGLFTALVSGTATVTASAGNVSENATVTVTAEGPVIGSIEVTPPVATLAVNGTEQFSATVRDQFNAVMTGVNVTWDSDDETVGTIDDAGLFTALAAGTATVTASAGNVSETATVTVNDNAEEPVLTTIEVAPTAATLAVNGTEQFSATVRDQFNAVMTGVNVTWDSDDETVGTIDDAGLFTALAAGTATVTASAGNVSGTATVTVTGTAEEPALAKVLVSPSAVTLEVDDARMFTVVAFDGFGRIVPDAEVTWTSSDPTVGTIDDTGLFTAVCNGTATVTATAGGVSGTATVTVNCDDPVLTQIVVTPSAIALAANDTEQFIATVLDQNGCDIADAAIDWTSSDEGVGRIDPCSGLFTAVCDGATTVTARCGDVTGTAEVTVTTTSSGVAVSPSAVTMDAGDSRQFTATVHDLQDNISGSIYDLQDNASNPPVTWSCNDEGVGTITADGFFTAICDGTATITASAGNASGTATVTVRSASPALARIVVSPSDFTIAADNTLALTATAFDQNGSEMPEATVTWASSDPAVGTIDECGNFTALSEGNVTLTASADGITGSACVTVGPSFPVPARIEIEPAIATLETGKTREFVARVYDQCDDGMDWVRVAWSCADPAVGTIDAAGLFAALAEGSTNVTAAAGSVQATAPVTVTATPEPEPTAEPTAEPTTSPTDPGNGGSDGDGASGPTFDARIRENIERGETFTFSEMTTSSVDSVSITAADAIPKLMLTVKKAAAPSQTEPPAAGVYEYVEVALSWVNQNDISGATVTFAIPARWLEQHSMAPEDVRLLRYVNGGWQILDTEVIGEEDGTYLFRATTPGFSTFAIAAAPENVTTTPTTTSEETNVTEEVTATPETTEGITTEPTAWPTTTPTAPLTYAPLLAPLAFFLWARRNR